jgi:hypothetical protein
VTVETDSAADVMVTGADDVAAAAALGVPLVALASEAMPRALIDAADAIVFDDDAPSVVTAILQRLREGSATELRERVEGTALISALSAEAARIADALARLAEDAGPNAGRASASAPPMAVDAAMVRALIKLRRDRDRHFPSEIFADPAWDMLLDLAAARLEGQRVSVSSLCIASAVPTTTALRWIRSLSEAGLFVRATDARDARRTWIGLSDEAHQAMMAWLRRFAAAFSTAARPV